jgi:multidrug resistance efflux pump
MKLLPIFVAAVVIPVLSAIAACTSNETLFPDVASTVEVAPSPTPSIQVLSPSLVAAEGIVLPIQEARLSMPVGGQLVAVNVAEGEQVKQGEVLAQLENGKQQITLASAQANLASAQAELKDLMAGPQSEEITKAEADLQKAQAALAKLVAGSTAAEIAEAEAQVNIARAQLAQALAGNRPEQIEAAAARVLRAEVEVRLAQARYDQVVFGVPTDAEPAAVELQKATLAYEEAKAQHEELVNGSTEEEIQIARAQVAAAQATLAKVSAPPTPEEVLQAQANVTQAQAALDEVKAGVTASRIAVGQSKVDIAQVNVTQAQFDLEQTQLVAPFDGTVSAIKARPGEMVQPGSVLMILGDTSRWRLETIDLTEADVARLQIGQSVQINVDALPGQKFAGTVIGIAPISQAEADQGQSPAGGDVTFKVTIEIKEGNLSALRWGMTAFIQIETERL